MYSVALDANPSSVGTVLVQISRTLLYKREPFPVGPIEIPPWDVRRRGTAVWIRFRCVAMSPLIRVVRVILEMYTLRRMSAGTGANVPGYHEKGNKQWSLNRRSQDPERNAGSTSAAARHIQTRIRRLNRQSRRQGL